MQSILSSVPKTIYIKYCIKFNFQLRKKVKTESIKAIHFFALILDHVTGVLGRDHQFLVKCGRLTTSSFEALKILHRTISFPEIDVCFKVV